MKETTLITGASSGIGFELARQFAKHGHGLILTAPVESELRTIAKELTDNHGVSVQVIAKDLRDANAAEEIFSTVQQMGPPVEILVNNAGLGQKGNFWEIPLEKDIDMLRVNVEAVVRLTKLFLPPMLRRKRGRILNTASVAGFEPGPHLAIYHATKAFVLSLSEALAVELKESGITVTALCPGATDTDFFPKAGMVETKIFQKGNVMAPQEVAEKGYDALMRGDPVYVPGTLNKLMVSKRRVLSVKASAKANSKFYEDVDPEDHKREPHQIEADAAGKH